MHLASIVPAGTQANRGMRDSGGWFEKGAVMKKAIATNRQIGPIRAALALLGVPMIAIALAADWLGIGGQRVFGHKQTVLAIAGGLTVLIALGLHTDKLLARTRTTIPPSAKRKEMVACCKIAA